MRRIGIYGGTFNPPHLAHKRLALEMAEKAQLDRILIIPTFVPPHKEAADLASCEERLEMCKRTFCEDIFFVSDIEIQRQGKSYTIDTLCALEKLYDNSKFFLIIGSDMLLSFHRWFRYEDILKKATLCVISRSDDENARVLQEYAKNTLGLSLEKGEIIISRQEPIVLSSTAIREKVKKQEPLCSLVEEQTEKYIKEKRLYI